MSLRAILARRLAGALLSLLPGLVAASVVEEVVDVPVAVKDFFGRETRQPIKVVVFHDDTRPKAPWLVLNHGRPPNPGEFSRMPLQRFPAISRYLVSLGFVVLVPTRVGYGPSGGPDVEYSGRCANKTFTPTFAAAADETVAVARAAEALPYVDASRGLAVGQSVGGLATVAVAARELPGLVGAVNFSGGAGGDPERRPEDPCGVERLTALYAGYGAAAKVPMLWLYSANDRYWGAEWPLKWFDTYVHSGGQARFAALPPFKDNGHAIFVGEPSAWQPAFESFVHGLGF